MVVCGLVDYMINIGFIHATTHYCQPLINDANHKSERLRHTNFAVSETLPDSLFDLVTSLDKVHFLT